MQNNSKLISEGSPTALNRLTRYHTVQEQANNSWNPTSTTASVLSLASSASAEIRLRFTDVSLLQGDVQYKRTFLSDLSSGLVAPLAITDCQLRGVYQEVRSTFGTGTSVNMTNNLVLRSQWYFFQDAIPGYYAITVNAYNNLFFGGTLWLTYNDPLTTTWTVKDNLFDSPSLGYGTKNFVNSNNGYTTGLTVYGGGSANQTGLTTPVYLAGPAATANWYGVEGKYYYSTTDGNLSRLINTGSRSPISAGLYHHTVKTANTPTQNKEGTDGSANTAIGFHYAGANSQNQPIDTDGDGAADVSEDKSGNNQFDSTTGTNPFGSTSYSAETQLNSSFTLQTSFAGPYDDGSLGSKPPDTMGAVGPTHFIVLIDQGFYVFDRNGNFVKFANHTEFFGVPSLLANSPRGGAFDPRILYDQQSGRWITCALENNGPFASPNQLNKNELYVAVSKDSNPVKFGTGSTWIADNWNKFLVRVGEDTYHSDFDTLGVDGNGVYIAMLKKDNLQALDHNSIFAIPKSTLLNPANPQTELTPTKYDDSTPGKFFIQPAINFDSVGPNDPAWFIQAKHNVSDNRVSYKTLTWNGQSPNAPTSWTEEVNAGIMYAAVPTGNIPQPSSGTFVLDAPLAGLSASIIRNNTLWTCHTVGFSSPTRSGCQWLSFSLNITQKSLAYANSGTVVDSTRWYYCPSLIVNTRGEMLMGFSGSSVTEYVSAFFATRPVGGVFSSVRTLKQGEAVNFGIGVGNIDRPGDYSATSLDPNDGITIWTIQEHASVPGSQGGPPWGAWIGAVSPF